MSKQTELHKITDKQCNVEVYHAIMHAAEAFSLLQFNIPKLHIEVAQHIHGRFDDAAFHCFIAANTKDIQEKLKHISIAKQDIFYQYSSLEYLVKVKGLTIGGANTVIDLLSEANDQLGKWQNFVNKQAIAE